MDHQPAFLQPAANGDAAAIDFWRQAMLQAVFYERLQQHGRDNHVERVRIQVFVNAQLVAAKADYFDVQVVVNELDLFAQLDELVVFAEQAAENLGEFDDQLASAVGIESHQG